MLWQHAARSDFGGNLTELLHVRQVAIKQEIRDLLEASFLRHLVDIVAAIHQAGVRIDPADLRLACDHAGEARTVSWFGFFFSCHCYSPRAGTLFPSF